MKNTTSIRSFLKNNQAISEEFTVLPALSIVMVGFALFVLLIAQTYLTHANHIQRLQDYQTTDKLLQKLTNHDCYFIREGGIINLQTLQNDTDSLQKIFDQYKKSGGTFLLRLRWNNQTKYFPEPLLGNPLTCIAVSKELGLFLNEAQTIPGDLTLFLWEVSK